MNSEKGFPEERPHQPERAWIFHLYICIHIDIHTYMYINVPYLAGRHAALGQAPGPGLVPARVHVRYMYVHICMYMYMYSVYLYVYVYCICICILGMVPILSR